MVFIVRGLVWLTGSLSVAVLLRGALELPMTGEVAGVLAGCEQLVALLAPAAASLVEFVLPAVDEALGSGATLQPHAPLIFLIVLLHFLPRLDETYGLEGVASGVLWCLQSAFAVAGAVLVTAALGAAPLFGENLTANFLLLVFLWTDLISNVWGDVGGAFAERVGELETGESQREVTWGSILRYAAQPVFFLTVLFAAMIYFYVRRLGEFRVDVVAGALLVYAVLAALILLFAVWRRPRVETPLLRRSIFAAPVTTVSRIALLGAALFVSGTLPVEGRSARRATRYVMGFATLAAMPLAAVVIGASFAIDWATGRAWDQRPPPAPSALGLFILGGASLVFAGYAFA
ncbi:MAG: hypothetical protein JNL06_12320 [Alphaproteobacteria bacterium]|nr:hypothetical protein [Alphaproteobacteria bacterium]